MKNEQLTAKLWAKYFPTDCDREKAPSKAMFDYLNRDNFWGFYSEGDTAWAEFYQYPSNGVYEVFRKFVLDNGYKWLWDN